MAPLTEKEPAVFVTEEPGLPGIPKAPKSRSEEFAAAPTAPPLPASEIPVFQPEPDDPLGLARETQVIPPIPVYILGEGLVSGEVLSRFLLQANPGINEFAMELARLYVEEAAIEGVNHDAAFAQMCLETGFLRFGGLVTPDMNNFCGLGAGGPGQRGDWFPDPRTGVRAHIQHLKAYASEEPLKQELVDPRYFWIRYGSVPKISGLSGVWATDRMYGDKINSILKRLYEFSFILNHDINKLNVPVKGANK